jgi:hypothetical protein
MKKPKHIDVMRQIDRSPFRSPNRPLPQGKWAELMRAIADDIENDELDEDGKNRVMLALGRAAVEMDQNEKKLKTAQREIQEMRGMPERRKVPKDQEPTD